MGEGTILRGTTSGIIVGILLTSMFVFAASIQPVKSWTGTVYIRADGSIDPSDAPIQRNDQVYTLVDNIAVASFADGIMVQRSGVVIDGNGHVILGSPGRYGVSITSVENVTVKDVSVKDFIHGIVVDHSPHTTVFENSIAGYNSGGMEDIALSFSNYTSVSLNSIINSGSDSAISVYDSFFVTVFGNSIINSGQGIRAYNLKNSTISANNLISCRFRAIEIGSGSTYNTIPDNYVKGNNIGIHLLSGDNEFYHNTFLSNSQQVSVGTVSYVNVWDDGYPSGGNYWSDYTGVDEKSGLGQNQPGSDGIGDTRYVVDANNNDNYPLMSLNPVSLMIDPPTQPATAREWKTYTLTVSNNYHFQQDIVLQGPVYEGVGARAPYCDWSDGPFEYSTRLTVGPRATKQVTLNVRVDVFWPPFEPMHNSFDVMAFTVHHTQSNPPVESYAEVASIGAEIVLYGQSTSTITGAGTAYCCSSAGTMTGFTAVDESTLPAVGKPLGVAFPDGLFSFTVTGLTPRQTITVYIQLPSALPAGSQYWKYEPGNGWFSIPMQRDSTYENMISVTVTDGGAGDADGSANGVIVDPGGPTISVPMVSIEPLSASIYVGQSVTFTSTVSGGDTPYTYQWYLNGAPVSGATSAGWTLVQASVGSYVVYLKVIDASSNAAQSNTANASVVPRQAVGGYSLPTNASAANLLSHYLTVTAIFVTGLVAAKRKLRKAERK